MWNLLLPIVGNLIERIFPDPIAQDKAKLELMKLAQEKEFKLAELYSAENLAQLKVNENEAANPSMFVAGWRPFVGWISGIAFAAIVGVTLYSWISTGIQPNLDFVWAIMGGMLGIGGMRTVEKVKGVSYNINPKILPNKGKIVDGAWKPN
ncbi:MAG: hypothetical protein C0446_08395 [Chitinophaga sp.]|nr:hypothetical protein [Chitinophaga sp.]